MSDPPRSPSPRPREPARKMLLAALVPLLAIVATILLLTLP